MDQTQQLCIELPDWLDAYCRTYRPAADPARRMAFVIEAARRNVERESGGPFAAAVFERDSGALVSLGVNLVTTQGLSILHAEVVAIALAQRRIGCYNLGAPGQPAHELVTSVEPCTMCLGAICWSGVHGLVSGANDADARAVGFDEGPKPPDWRSELHGRGIPVQENVGRDAARAVLEDYKAAGGWIYNSREGG